MIAGGINADLLELANQKATQLKNDKLALYQRLDEVKSQNEEAGTVINLSRSWQTADYNRKKAVAMIIINKIIIAEDGNVKIEWNI